MSYPLVDAILRRSPIRGVDRWVLVALASYCRNGGNECWPSVAAIARRAGLSQRPVLRAIPRLEAGGAIEVQRRTRRRNRYRVQGPSGAR
jgi:DNA-binding MarR family transcriptional regulator